MTAFTSRIRRQIISFLVIALVGSAYVATKYIKLPTMLGLSGYTVTLEMPDTGGIFTNAEVTYHGVAVGRVDELRLTPQGVEADLRIEEGVRLPGAMNAVVANRSAIGEQYVDLRPSGAGGRLKDGARVPVTPEELPIPVAKFLSDTSEFVESVPGESLRTTVDELYLATKDSSQDMRTLIDASQKIIAAAQAGLPQTLGLIENSGPVLATQQRASGDITSFSSSLAQISAQLKTSDPQLRQLISAAPGAAAEVETLISEVGGPLGLLMSNLLTTATVFSTNADALQGIYVRVPQAVSAGYAVNGPEGLRIGLTTTFFDPLPCTTGYEATTRRGPSDTSDAPLNTEAECVAPKSSGTGVRGPAAVTRGAATPNASAGPDQTSADATSGASAREGTPVPQTPADTVRTPTTLADLMGGR